MKAPTVRREKASPIITSSKKGVSVAPPAYGLSFTDSNLLQKKDSNSGASASLGSVKTNTTNATPIQFGGVPRGQLLKANAKKMKAQKRKQAAQKKNENSNTLMWGLMGLALVSAAGVAAYHYSNGSSNQAGGNVRPSGGFPLPSPHGNSTALVPAGNFGSNVTSGLQQVNEGTASIPILRSNPPMVLPTNRMQERNGSVPIKKTPSIIPIKSKTGIMVEDESDSVAKPKEIPSKQQPNKTKPPVAEKPLPSVVTLFQDSAAREKQIRELNNEYLNENVDVIKIHTHAKKSQGGRGHQAAAVSVMEQLARDYCGAVRIEIIIEAQRDAMFVFDNLIPGFDSKKDTQNLVYGNCNFTVIRHDEGGSVPLVSPPERAVGIYPADDREIWERDDTTNITYSKKMMTSMGVQKLMALNPHGWGLDKRFIDTGHKSFPIEESQSSIFKGGTYKDLAQGQMSPINKVVEKNILQLANLIKAGQVDLWAVYGLHYADAVTLIPIKDGNSITSGLVKSAAVYQRKRGKPLVIVNLSNQKDDHTKFIRQNEGALGSHVKLSYGEMTKPMQFKAGGSNNVIFVDMVSGVPKDWFSFIVDHATLPVVYEGANTANLAHQLGKSFLSIRPGGDTAYVEIPGFEKGRERLIKAGEALAKPGNKVKPESIVPQVLSEMSDPKSDVAKYVKQVLEHASKPESDQVLMALSKLRET